MCRATRVGKVYVYSRKTRVNAARSSRSSCVGSPGSCADSFPSSRTVWAHAFSSGVTPRASILAFRLPCVLPRSCTVSSSVRRYDIPAASRWPRRCASSAWTKIRAIEGGVSLGADKATTSGKMLSTNQSESSNGNSDLCDIDINECLSLSEPLTHAPIGFLQNGHIKPAVAFRFSICTRNRDFIDTFWASQ